MRYLSNIAFSLSFVSFFSLIGVPCLLPLLSVLGRLLTGLLCCEPVITRAEGLGLGLGGGGPRPLTLGEAIGVALGEDLFI